MSIAEANNPIALGVRAIIAQKGLKQVYVAEKAGYTTQELNDMLNGRRLIKACDIPELARALRVKTDDIYEAGMKEVGRDEGSRIEFNDKSRRFIDGIKPIK